MKTEVVPVRELLGSLRFMVLVGSLIDLEHKPERVFVVALLLIYRALPESETVAQDDDEG